MDEDITKHLGIVQSIITRMATNSFLLKGWSVTLTAALFALAAKDSNVKFLVVALLPAMSFWGLDSYYLRQERLFRKLYDDLRLMPKEDVAKVEAYTMSTGKYEGDVQGWFRTLWSKTVIALHGIVVGAVVLVIVVSYLIKK
jgi:hypothetical protein